jgi:chromosome segregation ATPase
MADTEVENTLREIRERVLASSNARAPEQVRTDGARNGDTASHAPRSGDVGEALARMDANLSTTGRAWSRLPPVLTYRRGAFARVELWLKRLVKRAAHWFTWEQVNFNSAAHNALGDARAALDAHASALASLREELSRLRAEVESGTARASELEARVSSAESRFDSGLAELRGALASAFGEQRASTDELRNELRERADGLLEEQRVSFRQLSLEAAELAVTHDRARRGIEARLEALEKRVTSDE